MQIAAGYEDAIIVIQCETMWYWKYEQGRSNLLQSKANHENNPVKINQSGCTRQNTENQNTKNQQPLNQSLNNRDMSMRLQNLPTNRFFIKGKYNIFNLLHIIIDTLSILC